MAFNPSGVVGILTKTCSDQERISRASSTIPCASVLSTSALTGPCTTSTISSVFSFRSAVPARIISVGLVVTPSSTPQLAASRI